MELIDILKSIEELKQKLELQINKKATLSKYGGGYSWYCDLMNKDYLKIKPTNFATGAIVVEIFEMDDKQRPRRIVLNKDQALALAGRILSIASNTEDEDDDQ
jgi:pantothenate kinase